MTKTTRRRTPKAEPRKSNIKATERYFGQHPPNNPVVAAQREVFLSKCNTSEHILIPRTYLLAFEDYGTAAFVQHMAFLMERSKNVAGWVYHSNWHLSQELCMTEDKLNRIKKRLKVKGILETHNPTGRCVNYRLIPAALEAWIAAKGIVTGNEEWDFGLTKPEFLLTGKSRYAKPGSDINREVSLRNPLPLEQETPGEDALRAAYLFSETEAQADTLNPADAAEPQDAPEEGIFSRYGVNTYLDEVQRQESVLRAHREALQLEGSVYFGEFPAKPLPVAEPPPPEMTEELLGILDNSESHSGLHAHALFSDPIRSLVEDDQYKMIPDKCLEVAQNYELAVKWKALFPEGTRWTKSTATTFFRHWIYGRITEGFVDFLRDVLLPAHTGRFLKMEAFFQQERFRWAGKAYEDYLSAKFAENREISKHLYEITYTDAQIQAEKIRVFPLDLDDMESHPQWDVAEHRREYSKQFPLRFGMMILTSGTDREASMRAGEHNSRLAWKSLKAHGELCCKCEREGLPYPGHHDYRTDPVYLEKMDRHHDFFHFGYGSFHPDPGLVSTYEKMKEVVREFVVSHGWVCERFHTVAAFWDLDAEELKAEHAQRCDKARAELKALGWGDKPAAAAA